MNLTKRGFLTGATAFVAARASALEAAEPVIEPALDVAQGALRLRAFGPETPALRYVSAEPLLVLHARVGQPALWHLRNHLAETTSLQLCGPRGLGSLDDLGSRPATVAAGAEALVRFTPTDSGTAWFRPMLGPADQAGRGLSGVLIIDAAEPPAVDHDLVCFIRDWTMDAQNRLVAEGAAPADAAASVVTMGNKPVPSDLILSPGARLRLRLMNGSTRRVFGIVIDGSKPMIVAIDGQPSERFAPVRGAIPIGPGGRFDVMLDLPREKGQVVRVTLRGSRNAEGSTEPDLAIATIRTDGTSFEARPPVASLAPNPALPARIALEAARRAELTIDSAAGGWTVNGIGGINWPKQPILRVKQGDAVTLGFTNASRELVPLTLYGHALRLLHAKDDGWEPYWRDTLLLPPGGRAHVAFVADKPGHWPVESGFNAQAAAGLRCWFEVGG